MKRFQFGPEKVRQWRARQAELEEVKLQQLHAECTRITAQRQALEAEALAAEQAVRAGATIHSEDLQNLDFFKQHVRARCVKLETARLDCEGRIGQQQRVVIEARRAAELLDRLKATSLAEWHSAYDKEQEILSNELFLAKRKVGYSR